MTYAEYLKDTADLIAAAGLKPKNPEAMAAIVIKKAIRATYSASNWEFKRRQTTVGVTSSADAYDLPSDFESFHSIVQRKDVYGEALQYLPKSEFDRQFPYPASHATGTPRYFTIYKDAADDTYWQITFFPKPSGAMTIPLDYYASANASSDTAIERMPDHIHPVLNAFIAVYTYPYGTEAKGHAIQEAQNEILRAQRVDGLDRADVVIFRDSSSVPQGTPLTWYNY